MKKFNLIGIGERTGRDIPELLNVWKNESWIEPTIEEKLDSDCTILTM